ncbi:hypothetical protein, partial [Klebsiella pneumoniae]|uniref:hypothetical protein n=1 Tax=Klebsiella pneumoniae TaxID=573 RepID=UPI001C12A676
VFSFDGLWFVVDNACKLFFAVIYSSLADVVRSSCHYLEYLTVANYKIMVATRMRNEKKRG